MRPPYAQHTRISSYAESLIPRLRLVRFESNVEYD